MKIIRKKLFRTTQKSTNNLIGESIKRNIKYRIPKGGKKAWPRGEKRVASKRASRSGRGASVRTSGTYPIHLEAEG